MENRKDDIILVAKPVKEWEPSEGNPFRQALGELVDFVERRKAEIAPIACGFPCEIDDVYSALFALLRRGFDVSVLDSNKLAEKEREKSS